MVRRYGQIKNVKGAEKETVPHFEYLGKIRRLCFVKEAIQAHNSRRGAQTTSGKTRIPTNKEEPNDE